MKPALPMLAVLALALGACADRGADDATAPAVAPVVDQPTDDVPPANAPQPTTPASTAAAGAMPAEGTITFAGFGPARFGADAEAVRQAWGRELTGSPGQDAVCYYLIPQSPADEGNAVAFMIEAGKFARIDIGREGITAPGGGGIGMSADQVESVYADVKRQDHKYVEGGEYLRVADPEGGEGVLVFETGADGVVDEWRIGVPPQVDYVEGCS